MQLSSRWTADQVSRYKVPAITVLAGGRWFKNLRTKLKLFQRVYELTAIISVTSL